MQTSSAQGAPGRSGPPVWLRAATAADQPEIRALIRAAQLNPLGLHWPHFIVAEEAGSGRLVGVGQIKPHRDGSRELASIAVLPAFQGRQIGVTLVQSLLARAQGPLFLYCAAEMPPWYARFGFHEIPGSALPATMRPLFRLGSGLLRLLNLMTREQRSLHAMRHG